MMNLIEESLALQFHHGPSIQLSSIVSDSLSSCVIYHLPSNKLIFPCPNGFFSTDCQKFLDHCFHSTVFNIDDLPSDLRNHLFDFPHVDRITKLLLNATDSLLAIVLNTGIIIVAQLSSEGFFQTQISVTFPCSDQDSHIIDAHWTVANELIVCFHSGSLYIAQLFNGLDFTPLYAERVSIPGDLPIHLIGTTANAKYQHKGSGGLLGQSNHSVNNVFLAASGDLLYIGYPKESSTDMLTLVDTHILYDALQHELFPDHPIQYSKLSYKLLHPIGSEGRLWVLGIVLTEDDTQSSDVIMSVVQFSTDFTLKTILGLSLNDIQWTEELLNGLNTAQQHKIQSLHIGSMSSILFGTSMAPDLSIISSLPAFVGTESVVCTVKPPECQQLSCSQFEFDRMVGCISLIYIPVYKQTISRSNLPIDAEPLRNPSVIIILQSDYILTVHYIDCPEQSSFEYTNFVTSDYQPLIPIKHTNSKSCNTFNTPSEILFETPSSPSQPPLFSTVVTSEDSILSDKLSGAISHSSDDVEHYGDVCIISSSGVSLSDEDDWKKLEYKQELTPSSSSFQTNDLTELTIHQDHKHISSFIQLPSSNAETNVSGQLISDSLQSKCNNSTKDNTEKTLVEPLLIESIHSQKISEHSTVISYPTSTIIQTAKIEVLSPFKQITSLSRHPTVCFNHNGAAIEHHDVSIQASKWNSITDSSGLSHDCDIEQFQKRQDDLQQDCISLIQEISNNHSIDSSVSGEIIAVLVKGLYAFNDSVLKLEDKCLSIFPISLRLNSFFQKVNNKVPDAWVTSLAPGFNSLKNNVDNLSDQFDTFQSTIISKIENGFKGLTPAINSLSILRRSIQNITEDLLIARPLNGTIVPRLSSIDPNTHLPLTIPQYKHSLETLLQHFLEMAKRTQALKTLVGLLFEKDTPNISTLYFEDPVHHEIERCISRSTNLFCKALSVMDSSTSICRLISRPNPPTRTPQTIFELIGAVPSESRRGGRYALNYDEFDIDGEEVPQLQNVHKQTDSEFSEKTCHIKDIKQHSLNRSGFRINAEYSYDDDISNKLNCETETIQLKPHLSETHDPKSISLLSDSNQSQDLPISNTLLDSESFDKLESFHSKLKQFRQSLINVKTNLRLNGVYISENSSPHHECQTGTRLYPSIQKLSRYIKNDQNSTQEKEKQLTNIIIPVSTSIHNDPILSQLPTNVEDSIHLFDSRTNNLLQKTLNVTKVETRALQRQNAKLLFGFIQRELQLSQELIARTITKRSRNDLYTNDEDPNIHLSELNSNRSHVEQHTLTSGQPSRGNNTVLEQCRLLEEAIISLRRKSSCKMGENELYLPSPNLKDTMIEEKQTNDQSTQSPANTLGNGNLHHSLITDIQSFPQESKQLINNQTTSQQASTTVCPLKKLQTEKTLEPLLKTAKEFIHPINNTNKSPTKNVLSTISEISTTQKLSAIEHPSSPTNDSESTERYLQKRGSFERSATTKDEINGGIHSQLVRKKSGPQEKKIHSLEHPILSTEESTKSLSPIRHNVDNLKINNSSVKTSMLFSESSSVDVSNSRLDKSDSQSPFGAISPGFGALIKKSDNNDSDTKNLKQNINDLISTDKLETTQNTNSNNISLTGLQLNPSNDCLQSSVTISQTTPSLPQTLQNSEATPINTSFSLFNTAVSNAPAAQIPTSASSSSSSSSIPWQTIPSLPASAPMAFERKQYTFGMSNEPVKQSTNFLIPTNVSTPASNPTPSWGNGFASFAPQHPVALTDRVKQLTTSDHPQSSFGNSFGQLAGNTGPFGAISNNFGASLTQTMPTGLTGFGNNITLNSNDSLTSAATQNLFQSPSFSQNSLTGSFRIPDNMN